MHISSRIISGTGGTPANGRNGVRREQDGSHLIYFEGRFYRPVKYHLVVEVVD